ncbi:hypothetical protein FHU41_000541 [Psychromicrobium silvestre]|uniref:Actinobacteria/chloroflexi VLRF1 release factor domain-containing protein n=1 Tax=Psychromicrobium silvestre TaxID=1645614 RepID=A0A7Y9LRL9_9MICC|nr:acVLRF1 family peptidyl-tRNA hydrolase [Psychromicrobium silvestre]NYE94320.1 hypothetical protein [Psychromicrobium silvestre]
MSPPTESSAIPGPSPRPATRSRLAWVSGERLSGWLERFQAAHGQLRIEESENGVSLFALDGSFAELAAPWPVAGRPGRGADPVQRLASLSEQSRTVVVLLIRRGGYAVSLCRDGQVLASKIGTRYVQSRTAAGGWSQQRFARRRANQADAMIEAVADHAAALPTEQAEYLVLGGDKAMAATLIAEPAVSALAKLERLAFLDVPDPRAKVLAEAAKQVRSVRIKVTDGPSPAALS